MAKLSPITPDKKATTSTPKTPQQIFQAYWKDIEKTEKSLEKVRNERQKLVERFNATLLPLEQQLCTEQKNLIEKLLPFIHKKSLSDSQKRETFEWADELLDEINHSPFHSQLDLSALTAQLQEAAIAIEGEPEQEDLTQMRAHLQSQFGEEFEVSDEELLASLRNPELLKRKMQAFMAQKHAQMAQEDEEPFQGQQDSFDEDVTGDTSPRDFNHQKRHELLFSEGIINRLYKKLAHKFHPDRHTTPDDKAHYQTLMVQLSQAKQANDAFTIFQLYQLHIPNSDINLSEQEIISFNELLLDKKDALRQQINDLKYGNSVDALIYQQFKGRNKREIESNFAEHELTVQTRIQFTQEIHQGLKSINALKTELKGRQEARYHMENEFELFDLFDLISQNFK